MKVKFPMRRFVWIALVALLPIAILYSLFPQVFACPACFLFDNNGDGLKNYFTLDHYVRQDQGWHFSGMNYPYGEHIIYTDNQPLLAMVLRWVHHHITDMDRHVIGTLNMLLLLSICLAVWVIYTLFRRWQIGRWWSLGAAICITFLSPQLWRFQGHYGLGYVFFIPLLILLLDLLLRAETRRWLWSLLTALLVVCMSLIHMYFLLLSSVLILSVTVLWWWYHRKEKRLLRAVLPWLTGAILLPGLFLVGLRQYTDTITDRPAEPYGLSQHTLTFDATFFPFFPPLDAVWTSVLHREKPIMERTAYVGMVGFLLLPALLWFLFRRRDEEEPLHLHLKMLTGSAVVCWLMAAGIFYHSVLAFLWDLMPPLKQFRGLGRFGFPFYYLYSLVVAYLMWQLFQQMKYRGLATTGRYMLSAAFILWGFEAWMNIRAVKAPIFHPNEYLSHTLTDYVPILHAAGYQPEDFQAILQLPLVAIGNENMGVTRGFWTLREGIHASRETQLPLINYAMSRTSVSQGLDIVEFISTPYYPKRRAALLNDKPILLLCEEEFVIPAERKWIEKGERIGSYRSITLYSLPVSAFKTVLLPALPSSQTDVQCTGWYEDFEMYPSDTVMTGQGALHIRQAPKSIWTMTDTAAVSRDWIVSFWSYVDPFKASVPVPRMAETNPQGQVLRSQGLHRDYIAWSEAFGPWIEVNFPWTTTGQGHHYELWIDNTGPVIDNLLIRPTGDTCIYFKPEMILFNNLPIPAGQ